MVVLCGHLRPVKKFHGLRCRVTVPQAIPGLSQLLGSLSQPLQLRDSEPQLTKWLQDRGYAVEQGKLTAQQLPGQGRGLVTKSPIRRGELVLAVPEQLVLFPSTAAKESLLASTFSDQLQQLPDWSLLALFLAEQRYLLQLQAAGSTTGNSSSSSGGTWQPYIASLPEIPVGTVLDWTAEEVESLLAGSGLLDKANTIRAAAELLQQDLQPLIAQAKEQGVCPANMFSRTNMEWAVGICLSRSIRLDDQHGDIVLVPFADFANHDTSSEAYLMWDQQQKAVVLHADRAYQAGEQFFISYGPKSSGELLLSYGFCPSDNAHEAAHITFSLPKSDPHYMAKQQALAARNIPTTEWFAIRINCLPAGALPYAAFCAVKLPSASHVEVVAQKLFDAGKMPVVEGVNLELVALEALAQQCRSALKDYPQSMARDKELAATVQGTVGFEHRAAAMAAVRVQERQILARTEFVVKQQIRQLRREK